MSPEIGPGHGHRSLVPTLLQPTPLSPSSLKGGNCGLCSLALCSFLSPLSPLKRNSLGPFSPVHNNPARIFCPFPIQGSAARCLTGNVPPSSFHEQIRMVCSLMGEFPPYFYPFSSNFSLYFSLFPENARASRVPL